MSKPITDVTIWDIDSVIFSSICTNDTVHEAYETVMKRMRSYMSLVPSKSSIVVFKDRGNKCFRFKLYPDYKKGRPGTPRMFYDVADLLAHKGELHDSAPNVSVLRPSSTLESDDSCIYQVKMLNELGVSTILCHIDKDLDQIQGWHYNYSQNRLYNLSPREAAMNLLSQCITGDRADGIAGLPRYGPVAAKKILKGLTPVQAYHAIIKLYEEHNISFHDTYRTLKMVRRPCEILTLERSGSIEYNADELLRRGLQELFWRFAREDEDYEE